MRSFRIAGIALGATLAVTGLAGCGKFYWGQPSATQEQWDRDNRECMTEGPRARPRLNTASSTKDSIGRAYPDGAGSASSS
jgi:hypothetical protein